MKKFLTMLLVVAMIFTACFASASAVVKSDEQAGLAAARAEALDELNKYYNAADYNEEGLKMIKGIIYVATYGGSVTVVGVSGADTFGFENYINESGVTVESLCYVVDEAKDAIDQVPTAVEFAFIKAQDQISAIMDLFGITGEGAFINLATSADSPELQVAASNLIAKYIALEELYAGIDLGIQSSLTVADVEKSINTLIRAFDEYILLASAAQPALTDATKAELVKAARVWADDTDMTKEYYSNDKYNKYQSLIEECVAAIKAAKTWDEIADLFKKYFGYDENTVIIDLADFFELSTVSRVPGIWFFYDEAGELDKIWELDNITDMYAQAVEKALAEIGEYKQENMALYGYDWTGATPDEYWAGTNWTDAPQYIGALQKYLRNYDLGELLAALDILEDRMEDTYFDVDYIPAREAITAAITAFNNNYLGYNDLITRIADALVKEFNDAYTALGQYKNYFLNNTAYPYLGVNVYSGYGLNSEEVYGPLEYANLKALRSASVDTIKAAKTTDAVFAAYGQYCAAVNELNTNGEKALAVAQAQFERELEFRYAKAIAAVDGDTNYAYDYDTKLFLDRYVKDIKAVYAAKQDVELTVDTIKLTATSTKTAGEVLDSVTEDGAYDYSSSVPSALGYGQTAISAAGYATFASSVSLDLTGTSEMNIYNTISNFDFVTWNWVYNTDVDMSVKTAATANGVMAQTYYNELVDSASDATTWTSFFTLFDTYKAQLATIKTANELVYYYLEAQYKAALEAAKTPELTADYAVKYGELVDAYEKVVIAYDNLFFGGVSFYGNFVDNGYNAEFKAVRRAYARLFWERENSDMVEVAYLSPDVDKYLDIAEILSEMAYTVYDEKATAELAKIVAETSAAIRKAATVDEAGKLAKEGLAKLEAVVPVTSDYLAKDLAAYIGQFKEDMALYFDKFYGEEFTSKATTTAGLVADFVALQGSLVLDTDAIKSAVEGLKLTVKSTLTKGKSINLTWTVKGNTEYVEGYEIWRSTKLNSGYSKFFTQVAGKKTYKNTKSLVAGTRYYYKVRAIAMVGATKVKSDWSNKAYRIFK